MTTKSLLNSQNCKSVMFVPNFMKMQCKKLLCVISDIIHHWYELGGEIPSDLIIVIFKYYPQKYLYVNKNEKRELEPTQIHEYTAIYLDKNSTVTSYTSITIIVTVDIMIHKRAKLIVLNKRNRYRYIDIVCGGNLINRGLIACNGDHSSYMANGGSIYLNINGIFDNYGGYLCCKGARWFEPNDRSHPRNPFCDMMAGTFHEYGLTKEDDGYIKLTIKDSKNCLGVHDLVNAFDDNNY